MLTQGMTPQGGWHLPSISLHLTVQSLGRMHGTILHGAIVSSVLGHLYVYSTGCYYIPAYCHQVPLHLQPPRPFQYLPGTEQWG